MQQEVQYQILKHKSLIVLCFLSFAIVMALGGSPQYSTIEVAIYQYALFELNFNKAILLSFIQIIICA